jgi:hypothetical protein
MPRRAAAVSPQMLCYDDPMADVVSPGSARKQVRPRTKKHIAVPATAEQIIRGVGATKKDIALVRKVMLRLGYLKEESPLKGSTKTKPKKARKD